MLLSALLLSHLQHRAITAARRPPVNERGLGLISDLLQAQSPPPALLLSQQLRLLIRAEPQHFTLHHHLTAFLSISIALHRRRDAAAPCQQTPTAPSARRLRHFRCLKHPRKRRAFNVGLNYLFVRETYSAKYHVRGR